ncbi:MAG TPA: phospholipase A [Burkholderiaceae bacterium]|nr:phospholipase A [Burkholderiaceae bacterium]
MPVPRTDPSAEPRRARARRVASRLAALLCAALAASASARTAPDDAALRACASLADDLERLGCYDRAAGRAPRPGDGAAPVAPAAAPAAPAAASDAAGPPLPLLGETAKVERDARRALGTSLGERWELDPGNKQGTFVLRPYRPVYVLPVRWTDRPNRSPETDAEGGVPSVTIPTRALDATFQLSLKSKLWETIGGSDIDLWAAYTQQSYWQVYTPALSRPFRETNYEPELFAIRGFDRPVPGGRMRFVGLGINHQSNGRAEPLSRSWNRVILMAGFERGDWSLLARTWWRLTEDREDDDNPGIGNFIGRAEMIVTRKFGANVLSVQMRHSLRVGDASRGSVMLDWGFPMSSYLKGHLRAFSGYGESLIDFNHRQTTIGVGVSLAEWL